jgi:hypothetical protein
VAFCENGKNDVLLLSAKGKLALVRGGRVAALGSTSIAFGFLGGAKDAAVAATSDEDILGPKGRILFLGDEEGNVHLWDFANALREFP